MNTIEELIQKECPEGVEYKPLTTVANVLYGFPFESKLFSEDASYIPLIRIRDVVPAKPSTYYTGEYDPLYIVHKGDILVGMDGNFNLEKWNDRDGLLNQRVVKLSSIDNDNIILNNYLYHFLAPLFKEIEKTITGSTVKHLSAKMINSIEIPVPPLSVQHKIVEILDKFTSLEAELQAELEARKKQYEYYLSKLISSSNHIKTSVGEIAKFTYGYTDKALDEGDTRFIRITDITDGGCLSNTDAKFINLTDQSKPYLLSHGDLLMARTGATFGKTLYFDSDKPSVYASFLIKISLDNSKIINRYYWHFTKSQLYWNQANKLVAKGGQPQFNTGAISQVVIPIPSLTEQQRIVTILDKFEALINDQTASLAAEMKARHQQYEYYRDKLLTFQRKEA